MKPYETVEELLEAAKIHGPYVISQLNGNYYLITGIYTLNGIVLDSCKGYSMDAQKLLNRFIWQDGSPCGKLIEV